MWTELFTSFLFGGALFFSYRSIESSLQDIFLHKNTDQVDNIFLDMFLACTFWGVFYFFAH
jgi:hypothetical protein